MKKLFKSPIINFTPTFPNAYLDQIKVGDFDNDGNVDLAAAYINYDIGTTASPFIIYKGDDQGHFNDQSTTLFNGHQPMNNYVARMIVADFNNDGIDDVFAIDTGIDKEPFTGGQNKLYLSNNGYLFEATDRLPQQIANNHGASAGDVNNDGTIDLLVNALMQDGNSLQLNKGDGHFVLAQNYLPPLLTQSNSDYTHSPYTHTWSALIDINNNGSLDMILGNWDNPYSGTENSLVFFNDGTGDFSKSTTIPLPNTLVPGQSTLDIKALDLNQDGLKDLVISITNGGNFDEFYKLPYVQLLINKGNGIYADETHIRLPQNTQPPETNIQNWIKSIEIIDFNGDGYSDLFLDNSIYGSKLLLNDGNGNFQQILHFPEGASDDHPSYSVGAIADVNNDGLWDVIASNHSHGGRNLSVYLGTEAQKELHVDAILPTAEQMEKVVELYIGFFGRAPEYAGLDHYQKHLKLGFEQGRSEDELLTQIANEFWQAALHYSHMTGYQASMSDFDFIAKIYENVLGRPNAAILDSAGVQFWTDKMQTESLSHGEAVREVLKGAYTYIESKPDDSVSLYVEQLLENRKDIGMIFGTQYYSGNLTGDAAIQAGIDVLNRIDQHRESFEKTALAIYNHTLQDLPEIELVGTNSMAALTDTLDL